MTQLMLLMLLNAEVIQGPFPIAEHEPGHHQVYPQAVMYDDGSFAVAWVDSLRVIDAGSPPYLGSKTDIYVRFFDPDGEPSGEAYKIPKAVGTNWVYEPCLDADNSGNTILTWHEAPNQLSTYRDIRLLRFSPDGVPVGSPVTLVTDVHLSLTVNKPFHADLNDEGRIALAWSQDGFDFIRHPAEHIWLQRFDWNGVPQDTAFRLHSLIIDTLIDSVGEYEYGFYTAPRVALNDDGYVVVTWLHFIKGGRMFPFLQVFTPDDQALFPQDTMGHRIDANPDTAYGASRPEAYWLDDERYGFVVFWPNYLSLGGKGAFLGRVFTEHGLTPHPEKILVHNDSLGSAASTNPAGQYCTGLHGDKFVFTSPRLYYNMDDPFEPFCWNHCGGITGEVWNNEPLRRTTYFEYTPEWYPDTMNCFFEYLFHPPAPATACSEDRILWVYPRMNPDTIFEAYALITDWNMGVDIEEVVPSHAPKVELVTSIGPQVILRYSDCSHGFHANVFDAAGRKVDELHSSQTSGTITWGEGYGPGVYFIREITSSQTVRKVVLIK